MIEHKYLPLGRSKKDKITFVQKIVKSISVLSWYLEQSSYEECRVKSGRCSASEAKGKLMGMIDTCVILGFFPPKVDEEQE